MKAKVGKEWIVVNVKLAYRKSPLRSQDGLDLQVNDR